MYGYQSHTLDTLGPALLAEGIHYLPSTPKIGRSKLYAILTDRSYIGEIKFRGQWLRVEDEEFRNLFREQLRQATNWDERSSATKAKQLQDELVQVRDHQNRLLNLRMLEEIDAGTFAPKSRDLRDREAELKLEIDVTDRSRHEIIDIAVKAFELSQSLRQQWFTADFDVKRRILEILCLNWTLDGASLCLTMRKPFDLLAKGFILKEIARRSA